MRQKQPIFSIIVPTHSRPGPLAACLQALARLDYPPERFEVIVVDDGSQTPPKTVVASLHDFLQVSLLLQRHGGPAAARNAGAMRARGQYLAFTDDDCVPAADWLQALTARFERMPDDLIGGRIINALPENPYSTASQVLVEYMYTYHNNDLNHANFFASNNFAVPAERFRAIGGFDTSFSLAAGEDREFCDRWLYHGYNMTYAPEVLVHHAHALNLRTFWRQQVRYGRGAFGFHQTRARREQKKIKLEVPSFYLNLLHYPFGHGRRVHGLTLPALLLLSQGAVATGFFLERVMQIYRGIR
jgi:cellulose synthase/poly-beta-1,6-N-acetylglucosamine synthase-like glycosyltransferase